MANSNTNISPAAVIDPMCSSDSVWYKEQQEYSVSDKLDDVDAAIAGKAAASHTHAASAVTGLADVATSGSYNDLSDKPTIPNAYTHPNTHPATMITGLADVATSGDYDDLTNKPTIPAAYTHPTSHPATMITGLAGVATSGSYNDLSDKPTIPSAYTHPTSHPASMITGLATVATSGSYDDLTDKPTIPTVPSSLPANGGNADTVDNKHASDFAMVGHNHDSDYADINHTHTQYAASSHTHSNYASSTHNHDDDYADASHTHAQSEISGLTAALNGKASASHSHAQSEITGLEAALSGKASTSHAHSNYATTTEFEALETTVSGKANASHTHAQSDISGLATALAGKSDSSHTHTAAQVGAAASSHNHNSAYISKELQFTNDDGSFKMSYKTADGKNILTEMAGYDIGFYTIYSQTGVSGNPKTTEAWRMMYHKTGTQNGWVIAFGSLGSVYSNYIDANAWRGWKCLWDNAPAALWTGQYYMTSSDSTPQTIYPSKKLSECRNGWVLIWSDYDAGDGANNTDLHHDYVYKRNVAGENWSGQCMLCDIPRHIGSNVNDVDTERRIIKPIYVHDNRIEGSYQNAYDERNDVVLRAVYEF